MRHLTRSHYLPVAVASTVAATIAASAFGLPGAIADDPTPIQLEGVDAQPVAPVPTSDGEAQPSPVSAESLPSPASPDNPSSVASPSSADS